jgi:hypothetical protein
MGENREDLGLALGFLRCTWKLYRGMRLQRGEATWGVLDH